MKYNLSQAIQIIERHYNKALSMIEFEDGSGKSFNVIFVGENKKQYVRLK
jgi:hypothetical protein